MVGGVALLALGLAACTPATDAQSSTALDQFFNTEEIHSIDVQFDDADYQEMLESFSDTGDKNWISADVTIDGVTYENAGLRLKGNSSLQSLRRGASQSAAVNEGDGTIDAEDPSSLPWLIRLDKYVDGQTHSGRARFVIRGNDTASSLSEAVALAMLQEADVPTQQFAFTAFTVNGSAGRLRLTVDLPDDALWNDDEFGGTGYTYKAESTGNYQYHGDSAEDYVDVFEQKFGDDDMQPLIDFIDFINNSSDEEFAANIGNYLEVDEFARYLAMQNLVNNFDDISGPGNNSYLHYSPETGKMTVVSWDHNLAFGMTPGGNPGGEPPEGMPGDGMGEPPQMPGGAGPGGQTPGGMNATDNPLVTRLEALDDFAATLEQTQNELAAELITSGRAEEILNSYVALLTSQGGDLISVADVESDAASISSQLSADPRQTQPDAA